MTVEIGQHDSPSRALAFTGISSASAAAAELESTSETTGETPSWPGLCCLPPCLAAHWLTVSLLILEITVVYTQVTGGTNPAGTSPE